MIQVQVQTLDSNCASTYRDLSTRFPNEPCIAESQQQQQQQQQQVFHSLCSPVSRAQHFPLCSPFASSRSSRSLCGGIRCHSRGTLSSHAANGNTRNALQTRLMGRCSRRRLRRHRNSVASLERSAGSRVFHHSSSGSSSLATLQGSEIV